MADWIDYCKENHLTITGAFDPVSEHGIGLAETFKGNAYKCTRWALDNQNLFVRAWLDGYEVEKEKQYLVKMKDLETGFNFLNRHKTENYWLFSSKDETLVYQACHTRKELEEAGFGWTFDCEYFEIEEVKG